METRESGNSTDFRFPEPGFAIDLDDPKWVKVGNVPFAIAISQVQVATGLRCMKSPGTSASVMAINAQSIEDWSEGESVCILTDRQRGTAFAYIRQGSHIVAYRYNSEEAMRERRRQRVAKSK